MWEEERNPTQEMNAIMKHGRRNECHMSPEFSTLIRTLIKGDNIFPAESVFLFFFSLRSMLNSYSESLL